MRMTSRKDIEDFVDVHCKTDMITIDFTEDDHCKRAIGFVEPGSLPLTENLSLKFAGEAISIPIDEIFQMGCLSREALLEVLNAHCYYPVESKIQIPLTSK